MAKDPSNTPRFLSDAGAKPLQLSFYPRQIVMVGCAALASALLLFSSGVVVGRWYSASAVEATPTLSALDLQAKPLAAAVMPKLSFHEALPLPLPIDPEEDAEVTPEALEDQDPLPAKAPEVKPEPKPAPKPVEPPKKAAEPAKPKVAEAKPAAKAEAKKGTFTLQVGIFSSKKEAEALLKKLKSSGEKPFLSTSPSTGAYIVRIGTYQSLDDAKIGQRAFKNRSGLSAMIASK